MKKALMMALAAAFLASPALANNSGAKAKMMSDHYFAKIDANGDGVITKEESQAFNDKKFTEADTNDDGKISREEMTAMKEKEHREMMPNHKSKGAEKSDMEVDKPTDNSKNTNDTNDQ